MTGVGMNALELGCVIGINPDAHSMELDLVRWGVAIARKGRVPEERVLNAMTLAQITAHFRRRRRRHRAWLRPQRFHKF